MFCPNCGNQLDINATNCSKCGQFITQRPTENFNQTYQSNQTTKKNINIPKNKILLGIIALVILVGAFLGISYFLKGNNKQQEATAYFDTNKPIRIKENDLYGYIDSNGKKIVEPKFKDAGEFYENYAIVKQPKDNENNEYYALIDKKGNVALSTTTTYSGSIKYIAEEEVWLIEGKLYNKSLKLITPETTTVNYLANGYFQYEDNSNYTRGIMNKNGKSNYSYPTNGQYIYISIDISDKEYPDLKDDYCVINVDNKKYGIINCKSGKTIYEFSEKYISEKRNNIFEISDKDSYKAIEIIYIENDKIAYKGSPDNRLEYQGNHILEIRDQDYKYTYFDVKNNKTLEKNPNSDIDIEDAWELLTSFKIVRCDDGGYGIKKDNQEIVPCGWDSIDYVDDPLYTYVETKGKQLIYVKKDNKKSLYDIKSKKIITTFNTSYISGDYGDSVFIYYKDNDTKKTVVYNIINGKQQEFGEDVTISNKSNYFTVKKDNKLEYYNTDLKLIYTGSVN